MTGNELELTDAVEMACTPQNAGRIVAGRERVRTMDRILVLENIESIARRSLNITDYWEYRRFLELCDMLDDNLTQRVAQWGMNSTDADVREASIDFRRNKEQPSGP